MEKARQHFAAKKKLLAACVEYVQSCVSDIAQEDVDEIAYDMVDLAFYWAKRRIEQLDDLAEEEETT